MKRKAEHLEEPSESRNPKRRDAKHHDYFRKGLFDKQILDRYSESYSTSEPYRHGVIPNLIESELLRRVRSEIQNLSFTPKETDIYKIHQSGDLANLDGLDDSSLKLLPSLLTLRDVMYSADFREYLAHITGSGPLSGRKTDMAINVYTPGCHLLCHDDVIGSRRLSYILYLTDPDKPWKKEWGGALRLYPTQVYAEENGEVIKVPGPDHVTSIPPAFNQLSFFAVQPGESFHDVEEVYGAAKTEEKGKDDPRVRMAISGWYHIPQDGEEGYEEGLEERLAHKSSLAQLQGKGDKFDSPRPQMQVYQAVEVESGMPTPSSQEDLPLSSDEIDFLLRYIAPTYLTPDPLQEVASIFESECSISLANFLSRNFSTSIESYIQAQATDSLPQNSAEIEEKTPWFVARPPHKHRFLFQQKSAPDSQLSPLQDLLHNLIPSKAFQKWLALATGYQIISHNSCIRRFRRGQDYTLATGYDEDSPRIELCLSLTPTPGWGDDQPVESSNDAEVEVVAKEKSTAGRNIDSKSDPSVGGYLAYMAGDDDEGSAADTEAGSEHGVEVPLDMSTGARATRVAMPKKSKQDPAIYQAGDDDEDDGVLFSMPAGWNKLGIVLRDKNTMRFTKYVSRMAEGDRWDVVGEFEIVDNPDDDDDEDKNTNIVGQAGNTTAGAVAQLETDEEDDTHDDELDDDDDESDSDD